MNKFFAALASVSLSVLLISGYSLAQDKPSGPENTCGSDEKLETPQANNPHYSPEEPWKKRWAKGASHFMMGRFPEAEVELTEALKLAKEAGYTDVQSGVLQMLGLVYLQEGKHEQAISTLQQALDMEKASPTPFKGTIYSTLIGLGDAYRREKLYDKALPALQEAKGMMTPCSAGYHQLMENTAQVYVGMGKLPEAEAAFNELVSLAEKAHSDHLMYRYLTQLGEVQLQRKDYGKLAATLERAYPYVIKKFGADSPEANIFAKNIGHAKNARDASGAREEWFHLMRAGNKNLDMKKYALAAGDFERALKLAETKGMQPALIGSTKGKLGLVYSQTGNFKRAEVMFAQALPTLRQQDSNVIPVDTLAAYEKLYQLAKSKNRAAR